MFDLPPFADALMRGGVLSLLSLTKWTDFVQALCAIAALFLLQFVVARLRKQSVSFENFIGNDPVMLMRDGEIFEDALKQTRVSRSDLLAKLREANVLHFSEVRAVVLESTGDISVLHGEHLNEDLIEGVQTIR